MLRPLILLLTTLLLLTIDLGSKWYITTIFFVNQCIAEKWSSFVDACLYADSALITHYKSQSYPIISDLLQLHLVYNTGVAFSMPITGLPLQILTILLITGILAYYIRYEYEKWSRLIDIGFVLILSGALSHSYERIRYEKVIDFIDLKYFAIFNFADIFITLWALLILLASWMMSARNRESRKS